MTSTRTIYRIRNKANQTTLGAYLAHDDDGAWVAFLADTVPWAARGTPRSENIIPESVDNAMRDYNCEVAPSSECSAWQDYQVDLQALDLSDADAITRHADYWLDVAAGRSDDYDVVTGSKVL